MTIDTQALPCNIEAEQSLLGALLIQNDLLYSLPAALSPSTFFEPVHERIFTAIREVIARGGKADPVILKPRFDSDPSLADIGGGGYLGKLAVKSVVVTNAVGLAEAICDLATRRRIIAACHEAIGLARDLTDDSLAGDVASALASRLDADASEAGRYRIRTEREVTEELYERIKSQRFAQRFGTGFPKLDTAMDGGLYAGKLYGIVGRKKHGKTMLASSISTNLQKSECRHVFLALEMGSTEIHQRAVAGELDCFESVFRSGYGESERFLDRLAEYVRNTQSYRMYLDAPGLSFSELRHLLPALIRRHKLTGFVLDCWQLVGGKAKNMSTAEHLDAVAQWLAECCKKYSVWGLVTAQENQDENTRGGEGLRMAVDQLYRIGKSDVGSAYIWLDMMETRYTGWQGVGQEGQPALQLSPKFTHFEQMT